MKIGTLVKPTEDMYPKKDEYIHNLRYGNPIGSSCGFQFTRGEVGTVLDLHTSKSYGVFFKILTPKGVGWVRWDWIEVIL